MVVCKSVSALSDTTNRECGLAGEFTELHDRKRIVAVAIVCIVRCCCWRAQNRNEEWSKQHKKEMKKIIRFLCIHWNRLCLFECGELCSDPVFYCYDILEISERKVVCRHRHRRIQTFVPTLKQKLWKFKIEYVMDFGQVAKSIQEGNQLTNMLTADHPLPWNHAFEDSSGF